MCGHLSTPDATLSYLRQFAPGVLAAVRFDGGTGLVPDGALTDFVPHRHPGYLDAFAAAGDVTRVSALLGSCVSCWVDGTGCVAGRVRNAGSAGVTVENGASRPTDRRTGRGLGSRECAAGGASRVVRAE